LFSFDRWLGAAVAPEEAEPVGIVLAAAVAAGSRLGVAVDVLVAVCLRDGRWWRVLLLLLLCGLVFLAAAEEAETGAPAMAELNGLDDGYFFSGRDAVGLGAGEGLLLESGCGYG
jgi:hypothetical protein